MAALRALAAAAWAHPEWTGIVTDGDAAADAAARLADWAAAPAGPSTR